MLNDKEIDEVMKKFNDPNFDFETVMYQILGKLKKSENDLFKITNKIGRSITNYIDKEWGDEPIDEMSLAEIIVHQTELNDEYKKIKEVLTEEESFYLETAIMGALLNIAK